MTALKLLGCSRQYLRYGSVHAGSRTPDVSTIKSSTKLRRSDMLMSDEPEWRPIFPMFSGRNAEKTVTGRSRSRSEPKVHASGPQNSWRSVYSLPRCSRVRFVLLCPLQQGHFMFSLNYLHENDTLQAKKDCLSGSVGDSMATDINF